MKDKTPSFSDLIREERPFVYKKKKDFEFVSGLMSYLKKTSLSKTNTPNITSWWKQRIFCITKDRIKEGKSTWYPDPVNGECIIETHKIKGESKEEWKLRKRKLLEYYAPVIAIYHETIFSCFIKRIHPVLADKIYEQFQETKEDKIRP